jgi:non-canonical poly(A) RNA polymerase PAPD5/7
MDPNKADNDVSGGSSKAPLIAKLFSTAFRTLQEHMALLDSSNISTRRGQSILGCLLGGNYESFADQRSHMWSIHERSR